MFELAIGDQYRRALVSGVPGLSGVHGRVSVAASAAPGESSIAALFVVAELKTDRRPVAVEPHEEIVVEPVELAPARFSRDLPRIGQLSQRAHGTDDSAEGRIVQFQGESAAAPRPAMRPLTKHSAMLPPER